jgi:23S rRNA pseudouridine1911/1915/1917 synthase
MNTDSEKDYFLSDQHFNMRIDAALSSVSDLSRSALTKLIKGGCVSINGALIKESDFKITKPLCVRILIPANPEIRMKSSVVDFTVVYEDKDILIIDKPAGVVVHPGIGNHEDTLANGLMHQYGDELSSIGGMLRPGIVHRLDKDTSGLMVVAKNNIAHNLLSEQISKREVDRHYLALVWGVPVPACGKIENFLKKSPSCHTKMAVCTRRLMSNENLVQKSPITEPWQAKPLLKKVFTLKKQGKYALTHYECLGLSTNKEISLVKCKLSTGRTHQIRVHLSHIGHSIVGDQTYGSNQQRAKKSLNQEDVLDVVLSLKRQALHAYRLSFLHPLTGELLNFYSNLPSDILTICKTIGIQTQCIESL